MVNYKVISALVCIFFFLACEEKSIPPNDILTFDEKLSALSNLEITEISPQNGFPRQFEIYISQPLDHDNPAGERFNQQIFLSHRDESAPVVFMPSGYSARTTVRSELSDLLNANQIYVAHRFMSGARPEMMAWDYLTVAQAAADFHLIVELFKSIYRGKWISYGSSKNGSTALFHKRYYPDDVDATLAQVAPISFAVEDPRYETFLENVGSQAIRDKIKRFQIALLENRSQIIPLIRNFINNSGLTYSVSEGAILEFETLEYSFAFWQYGANDISLVPDSSLTAQEMYDIIESAGYLPYYSDSYIEYMEPFYYQMYTELGYYRLVDDHLAHLIIDLSNPSYSYFAPAGVPLNFNSFTMQDIHNWLQTEGNNIIYLYGEVDPWTAGAVELTGQTNALKLIQPGGNHIISLLNLDQKDLIYSTLENWLHVSIQEKVRVINKNSRNRGELFPAHEFGYPLSFY